MTASDVINAVREQNVQVAAGRLGQPPVPAGAASRFSCRSTRRAGSSREEQFEQHRRQDRRRTGSVVHLKRRRRATTSRRRRPIRSRRASSWAPRTTTSTATSTASRRVTLAVFQLPGSNALDTAEAHSNEDGGAEGSAFPKASTTASYYDTTVFVDESITSVYPHADRGLHPGLHRRAGVPAELAGDDHPDDRRARVADRHVRRHGAAGLLAEQPVAVRPGAGDRHRGGRRHRRGRERRALAGRWACRRATPPARRWTKSPGRSSPSRWCCAPCSCRPRSWPASAGSSSSSSP